MSEFRVRVTRNAALIELMIEVEPHSESNGAALKAKLENAFQTALSLRIPVTIVPAGTLPRFEMKASRWIR